MEPLPVCQDLHETSIYLKLHSMADLKIEQRPWGKQCPVVCW